jgi:hypothetical protein
MKHIHPTTKPKNLPASASLLETQQKVDVFGAFAEALAAFGEAIGIFLGLDNEK